MRTYLRGEDLKRIINILLLIISALSFIFFFNLNDLNQKNSTIYSECLENSFRIFIPNTIGDMDPAEAKEILVSSINKYKANLYTTYTDDSTNNTIYKKYVYINNSSYFDSFKTSSNTSLNFSMLDDGNYFSTDKDTKSNKVQTLLDFAGNDSLEIHNINELSSLSRFYTITLNNPADREAFIEDLSNNLNMNITESPSPSVNTNYSSVGIFIIAILYLLVVILLVYNLLNSYKTIGIYKLLGLDNKRIWLDNITPLAFKIGLFFIVISAIFIPFYFKSFNRLLLPFCFKLILIDIFIVLVSFLILSLPFLLLKMFKLTSILKNNKPTKSILIVNNIIKVIICIICLSTFINVYINYSTVKNFYQNSFSAWEKTKDYVIFPYVLNLSPEIGETDKLTLLNKDLYFKFNKTGSILSNFKLYSDVYLEATSNNSYSNPYEHYAMINPNYLIENPLYDSENNLVMIDENERNHILLIPEMYKNMETQILEYYNRFLLTSYSVDNSQKLNIIWIKNDQKLFSYNLEVNPTEGNFVENPFCFVVTESNCNDRAYRQVFGFNSAGNPFKIKINNDISPDNFIRPTLQELGIDNNLPEIVSVYDSVSSDIDSILSYIKILSGLIVFLVILLLFITIQNVINYYEQNKLTITIKKLHGFKLKDKYMSFYKTLVINTLIITVISILICTFSTINILLIILISLLLLVLECLISLIAFKHIEGKSIITVSKGGN